MITQLGSSRANVKQFSSSDKAGGQNSEIIHTVGQDLVRGGLAPIVLSATGMAGPGFY